MLALLELLLFVAGIYIVYNVLVGIFFFLPRYFLKKEKVNSNKELILLCFLPAIGKGIIEYNRNKKSAEANPYVKKYYMWKNLIRLNSFFLIFFGLVIILFITGAFGLLGSGIETVEGPSGEPRPIDAEVTADVFVSLIEAIFIEGLSVLFIIFLILGLVFSEVFLFIFLVLLPIIFKWKAKKNLDVMNIVIEDS